MNHILIIIGPSSRENLYSGSPTKSDSIQHVQVFGPEKNEISLVGSLDMILSNKRITKALIRLRGCAGWSASLLFTNSRRQGFLRCHIHDMVLRISFRFFFF